jgi:hypothetical protein
VDEIEQVRFESSAPVEVVRPLFALHFSQFSWKKPASMFKTLCSLAGLLFLSVTGLAQSLPASVVTQTSGTAIVIAATSGQRIEVYSYAPEATGPMVSNSVYASWSLSNSGRLISSPIKTGSGLATMYSYFNIPTVIAGPATLTITPGSAAKVVTVSYSIVSN